METKNTLETKLDALFRLTDTQKYALKKLGLETAESLLRYLPARYINASTIKAISELRAGDVAAVEGKVTKLEAKKTWQKRLNITEAHIADASGAIVAVWFHQPYVSKLIAEGDLVRLEGKVTERKSAPYFSNPLFEKISTLSWHGTRAGNGFIPVYPATRGVSSRWIQFHIQKVFQLIASETKSDFSRTSEPFRVKAEKNLILWSDPIPKEILERYHLPSLYDSFRAAHFPKSTKEVEAARKRLAFEEIFYIQLARMRERLALEEQSSLAIPRDQKTLSGFLSSLSFKLTKTQSQILDTILSDISQKNPMARLLEGDVGSGKTVIAAVASYMAAGAGFQTTYMAPTEILALQHFESFSRLMGTPFFKIGLLTSSGARVYPSKAFASSHAPIPKSQLLRWVASGEIKILIGTHALLNGKINFKNLAFIVVDEQHRFGITQRMRLARAKSREHAFVPHFLSMTATPIPRTLALTVFGDLDLSVLDELPPGRSPIITEVLIKPRERLPGSDRTGSWDHIRRELEAGRQAFMICPRIDPGEDERKSVKKEYEHISREIFPEFKAAMLHGKQTAREKEKTLDDFRAGKINILVATSVIEVGIDVPNATIMIVEGAESFGLAQLHQLRGRIGRGEHQSYFYAISESSNATTAKRLRALRDAKNGFELAEYDLQLRGPGELTGKNQWGLSDIGMEALKNIKMVEAARAEARALLEKNRTIENYPLLKTAVEQLSQSVYHFE